MNQTLEISASHKTEKYRKKIYFTDYVLKIFDFKKYIARSQILQQAEDDIIVWGLMGQWPNITENIIFKQTLCYT